MADELKRSCCSSHVNEWHTRPCTVNGPVDAWHATSLGIASEALAEEERSLARRVRVIETEFTETVIDFGYYRTCCSTAPGSPHWQGCGTNFFAKGQTVIKPDMYDRGLWERGWLRIAEDRVSSDRTFENETRPL